MWNVLRVSVLVDCVVDGRGDVQSAREVVCVPVGLVCHAVLFLFARSSLRRRRGCLDAG